jgi:D-hexose-6-phosphate mutarotase
LKDGSEATVVWNPFPPADKPISDFGDGEWTSMVCVETANVRQFSITLNPGESHETTAVVGE